VFIDKATILVREYRGKHLISRTLEDKYHEDCIKVRYNNYSEAMFWGTFSYDYKGPYYVYLKETKAEKAKYKAIIDKYNTILLLYKEAE
jgi:hypothetical protein